ncbi:hypothetical protein L1987_39886 [Smallanthus sonchifolius]|uniref:Uncharacterized protein n=1 Tax=Smallanthus sonchifolius TaxID=185202 RepID=A0ACB9GS26_9ASTR|nr:hypothetical protein L1987_39886 [Smallanthus sonchifolius]
MILKSYANLLDLANGNFLAMEEPRRKMFGRTMNVPGFYMSLMIKHINDDRLIVVANQLPLKAIRLADDKTGESSWSFNWDENSLYKHIKDGLLEEMKVIDVDSLRADVDPSEQDDISQIL